MDELSLKDYLLDCSTEELMEELKKIDASIMALHHYQNLYIVGFDASQIKLYNGQLNLKSFNNKLDYLNSENSLNPDGDKKDILEMCAVGICAYNGFKEFYTNKEFIGYLITNFDAYCRNGKIPEIMVDYYYSVLVNGEIDYLNNFLYKRNDLNASSSQVQSNSYRLSKSTAIGRAYDSDDAFVSALMLPLISIVAVILIFAFVFLLIKQFI